MKLDAEERMRARITQLVYEVENCKADPSPELQRMVRVMLAAVPKLSNTPRWRITEILAAASWLLDQVVEVERMPPGIAIAVLGQLHNPTHSIVVLEGAGGES